MRAGVITDFVWALRNNAYYYTVVWHMSAFFFSYAWWYTIVLICVALFAHLLIIQWSTKEFCLWCSQHYIIYHLQCCSALMIDSKRWTATCLSRNCVPMKAADSVWDCIVAWGRYLITAKTICKTIYSRCLVESEKFGWTHPLKFFFIAFFITDLWSF